MNAEQHEWYWKGYNEAKKDLDKTNHPLMDMPRDRKIEMAYGEFQKQKEDKYLYLNWQDGQNEWFITAAPFKCTKFKFKVEVL